jgi:long-subunit fatty acid transport protein
LKRALLLVLLAATAHASGPDLYGLSPRSGALAGAGVADGDGWDQVYTNPAGLADAHRRTLTLGYTGARDRLFLDGQTHGVAGSNAILLGVVLPIPFGGVLKDRVTLGLGFYLPTAFVTRASAPYPDVPRLPLLDARAQVVSVMVAGGFHLHDRVDVGVGVLALAALVGNITVTEDAAGNSSTTSNQELVTKLSPVVGVRVRATPWLRLGLVYRGQSSAQYDVKIVASLGKSIPIAIPTLDIAGTAQFDPHQLHAEAAFAVRWATIMVGLGWKHWSDFPLPAKNPTTGTPPQAQPGFHDTVVPRLAVEAKKALPYGLKVVGRLGYAYEESPQAAHTQSVYVDADRHILGAGAGLGWIRGKLGLHLDAFAEWQRLARAERANGDIGVFGAALGIDL